MQALAKRCRLLVNIGLTGDADADKPVLAAHARAGIDIAAYDSVDIPCAASIVSASDPDDEVRAAVRLVSDWMQQGIRLGRIAVVYGNADPYARLVQEHLSAAEIPMNGVPVRALGDMLLGRTLRALLALPDRDFRRQDVLTVLTDAPILDQDERIPSRAWDRLSRAAGIVSDNDWNERLVSLAAEERRLADQDDAEGSDLRAERRRHDADRAEALAAFVTRLRNDLAEGSFRRSWAASMDWAKGLIDSYLGGDHRRGRWPEDEQEAAHRVEESLDRLGGLDALGGPAPTVGIFRRALESELEAALRRIGRAGDGVLVGHVSVAPGLVFDRLVMLGMSEGRFPRRRLEDSLLPDVERQAAGGHLRLRTQRVHDDRRHLLAAIAGAGHAVLCQPRGDLRRSTNQPASRWLLEDAARLAGVSVVESGDLGSKSNGPWLEYVPSFAGGLARAQIYATDQELRLSAIARGNPDHPLLLEDAEVCLELQVVRARRSAAFTRFDGNLAAVAAEIGFPRKTSATQLETWAICPRRYLFGYLLGVEHVEEPERRLEIDPLTRGMVVHQILEEFICAAINEGHPLEHWSSGDHDRLQRLAASHFDRVEREGRTGRAMLWRVERARIASEVDKVLSHDGARLANGLRPVAAEYKFQDVEIALAEGLAVRMQGAIDRIDRGPDGSLNVLDYKTRSDSAYKMLSEAEPHNNGKHLQLYVYGRAAHLAFPDAPSVRADYWFTKTNKLHGYPISDRVKQMVLEAMHIIVNGIAAGVFPAHPSDPPAYGYVDCWYCTPDGLSSEQVRRDWERKRLDSALSGYLALTEPGSAHDVD